MSAVTFDNLKFARRLKEAGVSEQQAEAEAINDALDTQIATKTDIIKLDAKINLIHWMLGFNLILSFAMLSMIAALLLNQ